MIIFLVNATRTFKFGAVVRDVVRSSLHLAKPTQTWATQTHCFMLAANSANTSPQAVELTQAFWGSRSLVVGARMRANEGLVSWRDWCGGCAGI